MPDNIKRYEGAELNDVRTPQLEKLGKHIVRLGELAMEKVAANYAQPSRFPLAEKPKSFEAIFKKRFDSLRTEQKEVAVRRVLQRLHASPAIRKKKFGALVDVDLTKAVPVEDQANRLSYLLHFQNTITPEVLADFNASRSSPSFDAQPAPAHSLKYTMTAAAAVSAVPKTSLSGPLTPVSNPTVSSSVLPLEESAPETATPTGVDSAGVEPPPAAPTYNRLQLRIHEIRCIDETDGFLGSEAGTDEIAIGGSRILPNGLTEKIDATDVRHDFEDNVAQWYNPPWVFTEFNNLSAGSYSVLFVLAELDNGGLPAMLDDLVEKLKPQVESLVASSANEHLDNSTLAQVIAAIVVAVLGWLWNLFKEIWNDDLFPTYAVNVGVPSPTARFNGSPVGTPSFAYFSGHGGRYSVLYDWRVGA